MAEKARVSVLLYRRASGICSGGAHLANASRGSHDDYGNVN